VDKIKGEQNMKTGVYTCVLGLVMLAMGCNEEVSKKNVDPCGNGVLDAGEV
jgi:hypothetical protein